MYVETCKKEDKFTSFFFVSTFRFCVFLSSCASLINLFLKVDDCMMTAKEQKQQNKNKNKRKPNKPQKTKTKQKQNQQTTNNAIHKIYTAFS